MKIIKFAVTYVLKKKKYAIPFCLISVVVMLLSIFNPYLVGNIINILTNNQDLKELYGGIILLTVVWGMYVFLEYINRTLLTKIRLDSVYLITKDIIHCLQKASLLKVNQANPMYLNQQINHDAASCINYTINIFTQFMLNSISLFITLSIMISISFKITLILIVIAIIYYVLYLSVKNVLMIRAKEQKTEQSSFFAQVGEQLQYIKFIKIHSLMNFFEKRLEKSYQSYRAISVNFKTILYGLSFLDEAIKCIANIILFVIGGREVIVGELSIGMFIVLSSYFPKIISLFSCYLQLGEFYQETLVSFNRIEELLLWGEESDGAYIPNHIEKICLKNLSFNYKEKRVFSHINYTFQKGVTYALVGSNGTGKSTLIQIILGLLTDSITTGDVIINTKSIKECNMYFLRKKYFEVVEQESPILNDTIKTNIYFDRLKHNNIESEIFDMLNLTQYLKMQKQGIETIITPNNISGGEKQKINIARSLLCEKEVLIFDEPNSALDGLTTKSFIDYIESIKENKIIIIISHDLNVINSCDQILKLADYKISTDRIR